MIRRLPGLSSGRPIVQYGLAVAGVALATLVRFPFEQFLHGRAPYALYYLPILFTAWHGGVAATVLAILLSLASAWFFFIPMTEPGYPASLGLFLAVSTGMVMLARAARTTRSAAARTFAAEHSADQTKAYLAAITESSDDAIITKDLEGTIQWCNTAAEDMFGYTRAELVGQPVMILVPPDQHPQERNTIERLRRGERVEHSETVMLAKGGRAVDVSQTVSPVRDRSGQIIGASKIARDITEKKRTEAALATHREWLRVTLESIGDGVIASDRDGHVAFMNRVAETLTGWRVAEAAGRPITEVFHVISEDTRRPVEDPTARVTQSGQIVGLGNHTALVRRDGTEIPIADSAAPILDDHGRIIGVVLVFRDASDPRRMDMERRAALVERERLLESERNARAEAEKASRTKDDFMAIVSHELRTPLNAILGWTQMLLHGPADEPTRVRGLEVIDRNTRLQAQLIADLLDVSRIVSGKLRLDITEVDLAAVIDEAVQTVRPAAEAKDITLEWIPERPVPPVRGDAARLQQCISNLLSNAIKFTPEGGRVSVTVGRADTQVEVTVSDNGIGIPPEFLPHVFERFRQAESQTTRHFGGLGLGLSIVKQLVELHGGRIAAASGGKGQGATFTISLPLGAPAAVTEERRDATPTANAAAPPALEGVTVLVVEDDDDARDLVQRQLEGHHVRVLSASSAPDALRTLRTERVDILVSDIGLPGMDGYELMRRVREAGNRLPAIALTAYARSEDRTRALRMGYQAHIAKPVDPSELLAAVASFADLIRGLRGANT